MWCDVRYRNEFVVYDAVRITETKLSCSKLCVCRYRQRVAR